MKEKIKALTSKRVTYGQIWTWAMVAAIIYIIIDIVKVKIDICKLRKSSQECELKLRNKMNPEIKE